MLVLVVFLPGARSASAQIVTVPPTANDFFADTLVHEIRLTINPRDWDELKRNFSLNLYYPCHFTWNGITARTVGIRSRGTGSRSSTKPGLRVDFDLYDKAQRFLGLRSVVLRNNTQDPSNLHERLSMLVFTRMGIPAPRESHTRLFINDEYAGLYSIVESIDKGFLQGRFEQNDGYLYKYDYDPQDPPHYFEYQGPDPRLYSPKPFQPETHELDPDPKPIATMIRAIEETSSVDFEQVMAGYLDLRRFMVHVAVENFLADLDGILGDWGTNNFYFYRFENTTRSTFIAWDKSEAFKGGPEFGIWHNIADVAPWYRNRLMDRAARNLDLRDAYLDALLKCAEISSSPASAEDFAGLGPGRRSLQSESGWLEEEIVREYQQIRSAALEDPFKPYTNEQFEASIQQLLAFARERSKFVRAEVMRERRSTSSVLAGALHPTK